MPTRKESLFNAKKGSPGHAVVIPATVKHSINKRRRRLNPLSAQEKMICALRKVLAKMSDNDQTGCRFFIAGNKVQIIRAPKATAGRKGEPKSYTAAGRCKVGACNDDHVTYKVIEFNISFRDVLDDRGLADIEYMDPTTIDELARNPPVDISAIA
jgi:hypothetical protein